MSVKLRAAARLPLTEGVKLRLTPQLVPGARGPPQLFVWEKSVAFAPMMAMLDTLSGLLPGLVRTTDCCALFVARGWFPNEIFVAERLTRGVVPAPVKLTV